MKVGRKSTKVHYSGGPADPVQEAQGLRQPGNEPGKLSAQPVKRLQTRRKAEIPQQLKRFGDPVKEARQEWSEAITASDRHFLRKKCRCHQRRYSQGVVVPNMDPYEPCEAYLELWKTERSAALAYFKVLHQTQGKGRAA